MKQHYPISIIVPTYKKEGMLIDNLKKNLPFFEGCEVIVVNDNPDASIAQHLKPFASVLLVENGTNLGFAGAVNRGIKEASRDFVALFNSDVILKDNSFANAVATFKKDSSVFAIGFAQEEKGGTIVGKNRIFWKNGFPQHESVRDNKPGKTAWAEGGAALIDKAKFETIGGFDEAFSPFYWEDIDLCYRAWKHGYTVLFDPDIVVEHQHESTIGSLFDKTKVRTIAFRNQLLFLWKNIDDKRMLFDHSIRLGPTYAKSAIHGDNSLLFATFEASKRLVMIRRDRSPRKLSDKEIFALFE